PRSLSQRITSFIACACQGIHQLPLRHLIVLIANAHPDRSGRYWHKKTSFSKSVRWPAVKPPIRWQGLSVPADEPSRARYPGEPKLASIMPGRNPNKSSLHDVIQNRHPAHAPDANLVFLRMTPLPEGN